METKQAYIELKSNLDQFSDLFTLFKLDKGLFDEYIKSRTEGFSYTFKKRIKWTEQKIRFCSGQYKSYKDFISDFPGATNFLNRNNAVNYFEDARSKKEIDMDRVEKLKEVAKNMKSRTELKSSNRSLYEFAQKNNLLNTIFSHLPKRTFKFTDEEIKEQILNYPSKRELRLKNTGLYKLASRRNLLKTLEN